MGVLGMGRAGAGTDMARMLGCAAMRRPGKHTHHVAGAFLGIAALLALGPAAAGCITITNAPEDLELAIKGYWQDFESADDDTVAEATRNVDAIIAPLKAADQLPSMGRIGELEQTDLAKVGMEQKGNAKAARGVMVTTVIECSLDKLEQFLVARNQPDLYPEVYKSYERAYEGDANEYFARGKKTLGWTTHYSAEVMSTRYDTVVTASLRRVPDLGKEKTPFGPVLLARSYWKAPAQMTATDQTWKQDYQMEAYYEREPGKVIHLYATWRELDMGSYTMETDSAVKFMLNSMADWDDRTSELCKSGAIAPQF